MSGVTKSPALQIDVANRTGGTGGPCGKAKALRGPRRRRLDLALRAATVIAGKRFGRRGARGGSALDFAWVGDREMRALDRRARRGIGTTDVLAFPDGARDPETGLVRLGEIACNLELARRAARENGNTFEAEAVLYAVHGLVHLLGGRDGTPGGRRAMRQVETAALAAADLRVRGGEWGCG